MTLNSLTLQNFKRYRQKSFVFDEGLVGIIGKNGSGKSTIFEAILFALYGTNKGSKELLRNSTCGEKDSVSVLLEFEYNGALYEVSREFRGKALTPSAKLYIDAQLICSGAKEVSAYITKLVKMNKDAFVNTLFASQKELTSLGNLKLDDRKKIIRKLLGLEKIDLVQSSVVEKSRELKREIDAFKEVLLSANEEVKKNELIDSNESNKLEFLQKLQVNEKADEKLRQNATNLKKELENFQKTKELKAKLVSEFEVLKNSSQGYKTQLEKLTCEAVLLEKKEKELSGLTGVKEEFERLENELKIQQELKEIAIKKDALNKEQDGLRLRYKKIKLEIGSLMEILKDVEQLRAKESQIKVDLEKVIDNIKALERELKTVNNSLAGEQKLIQNINTQISKIKAIGKGSKCPTCTRELLDEYDNVINNLSQTITNIQKEKIDILLIELRVKEDKKATIDLKKLELEKELQKLGNQLSVLGAKEGELQKAKNELKEIEELGTANNEQLKALENFVYDERTYEQFLRAQSEIKPKYEHFLQLQTQLQRVDIVKKEMLVQNVALKECESQMSQKDELIKSVLYDELEHQKKVGEYELLQKQKDDLSKILSDIRVEIASIDGEIKTLRFSLDENKKHQERLHIKHQDLRDFEKIKIGLDEFKTKLNAKIAPRISQIASNMYAQITNGKYQHVEVSNDFEFFIYDDGKKFPIERFSGGEIDLANLVLRIAISKTLSELNRSANIGFLAFDEVFGSQDENRRMQILEAFHTIKEQYRQIFLISHEMEIKEMFERVVEV